MKIGIFKIRYIYKAKYLNSTVYIQDGILFTPFHLPTNIVKSILESYLRSESGRKSTSRRSLKLGKLNV